MTEKEKPSVPSHKEVFTGIYERCELGNDYNPIYKGSSGRGCTLEYNKQELIPFIKQFIIDKNIKTVVDLGCGNIQYAYSLYNDVGVYYYGYDVYEKVIEYNIKFYNNKKFIFQCADILSEKESLINAELCVIKDVLQHWTITDIYTLLDYFTSTKKYKYIIIINCCQQGGDIFESATATATDSDAEFNTGGWRQLSANYLPLKKYNPKIIFHYDSKELSVIQTYIFGSKTECLETTLMNVVKTKMKGKSACVGADAFANRSISPTPNLTRLRSGTPLKSSPLFK